MIVKSSCTRERSTWSRAKSNFPSIYSSNEALLATIVTASGRTLWGGCGAAWLGSNRTDGDCDSGAWIGEASKMQGSKEKSYSISSIPNRLHLKSHSAIQYDVYVFVQRFHTRQSARSMSELSRPQLMRVLFDPSFLVALFAVAKRLSDHFPPGKS